MQKIWIARPSVNAIVDNVIISKEKPDMIKDSISEMNIKQPNILVAFTSQEFYDLFGYMPKKGTCKEKEIVLKNLI